MKKSDTGNELPAISRDVHSYDQNILIDYDCRNRVFRYPVSAGEVFDARFDTRPLWQILTEDGISTVETAELLRCKLEEICAADTPQVHFTEYFLKNAEKQWRWYRVGFVCSAPGSMISITFTDIDREISAGESYIRMRECDELTGLLNRKAFCRTVEMMVQQDSEGVSAGEYAVIYLDILRFKAINDIFGMAAGDCLLIHMADSIRELLKPGDAASRLSADEFVIFTHTAGNELEELAQRLLHKIQNYDLPIEITCNIGIYVTGSEHLEAELMIDRAMLAQASIKDNYNIRCRYYTESLRKDMLSKQEITGIMATALAEGQFLVYYQPQYDHSTGALVGAEALVRWNHPERGLISPGVFIPIFEENGFISRLDLYVFEQVCRFLRKCMDTGLKLVPISANFSRGDIFQPDFAEQLEAVRTKYDVPAKYLRVEITEYVVVGGSQYVNEMVRKLHQYGYIVEMDDFGSGYSSLNVLKDIELDVIKLDMLFLSEPADNDRGGTILSSVVRMAKWLGLPVIAEGVETIDQADFLRSIGCDYIQGYLYSRPLPEANYVEILSDDKLSVEVPQRNLMDTLTSGKFWSPASLETLIFSKLVGAASIFDYHEGKVELLRVNEKYLKELGVNRSEKELIESDLVTWFDDQDYKLYIDILDQAIETGEEQECETWRTFYSSDGRAERICIRSNVCLVGKNGNSFLFYAMIRNITAEKERQNNR